MTQTQLDRIEERQIDMDGRLRGLEVTLAEYRGERRVREKIGGRWHAALREFVSPLVTAALTAGATIHFFGGR